MEQNETPATAVNVLILALIDVIQMLITLSLTSNPESPNSYNRSVPGENDLACCAAVEQLERFVRFFQREAVRDNVVERNFTVYDPVGEFLKNHRAERP